MSGDAPIGPDLGTPEIQHPERGALPGSSGACVGASSEPETGATIARDVIVDDVQRATHRGARIIGLSVGADTLALLWKKDARGDDVVLSLFDLDRAAPYR